MFKTVLSWKPSVIINLYTMLSTAQGYSRYIFINNSPAAWPRVTECLTVRNVALVAESAHSVHKGHSHGNKLVLLWYNTTVHDVINCAHTICADREHHCSQVIQACILQNLNKSNCYRLFHQHPVPYVQESNLTTAGTQTQCKCAPVKFA